MLTLVAQQMLLREKNLSLRVFSTHRVEISKSWPRDCQLSTNGSWSLAKRIVICWSRVFATCKTFDTYTVWRWNTLAKYVKCTGKRELSQSVSTVYTETF